MTNLPNNLDTFQRVSNNTRSENAHTDLHNNLADAVEAIEKYSGSNIVLELPATSEVNRVYTLKQTHQGRRPGIYICTQSYPVEYLNVGGVNPKEDGGLRFDGSKLEVDCVSDNELITQSPGYLIGGPSPSPVEEFISLTNKINQPLSNVEETPQTYSGCALGQSFTTTDSGYINSITMSLKKSAGFSQTILFEIFLADENGLPTGAALFTSSVGAAQEAYYDQTVIVEQQFLPNTKYVIKLRVDFWTYSVYWRYQNTDVYAGGNSMYFNGSTWTQYPTYDRRFSINVPDNNNGAIKINVDGTEYDNVSVDFSGCTNISSGANTTMQSLYNNSVGQSFTVEKTSRVKRIGAAFRRNGIGTDYYLTMKLYMADSQGLPIGSELASVSIPAINIPSDTIAYFDINQTLKAGKYHLAVSPSYQSFEWCAGAWYGASSYSGGELFINGEKQVASDLRFVVEFENNLSVTSIQEVADRLQLAIRATTGNTETVVYDTDHFIITSSTTNRNSQILKLMTPSSGTDISGAGATPYFDMADNATEVHGTGNEGRIIRLDKFGNALSPLRFEVGEDISINSLLKISDGKLRKIVGIKNQITSSAAKSGTVQSVKWMTAEKAVMRCDANLYLLNFSGDTVSSIINITPTNGSSDFDILDENKIVSVNQYWSDGPRTRSCVIDVSTGTAVFGTVLDNNYWSGLGTNGSLGFCMVTALSPTKYVLGIQFNWSGGTSGQKVTTLAVSVDGTTGTASGGAEVCSDYYSSFSSRTYGGKLLKIDATHFAYFFMTNYSTSWGSPGSRTHARLYTVGESSISGHGLDTGLYAYNGSNYKLVYTTDGSRIFVYSRSDGFKFLGALPISGNTLASFFQLTIDNYNPTDIFYNSNNVYIQVGATIYRHFITATEVTPTPAETRSLTSTQFISGLRPSYDYFVSFSNDSPIRFQPFLLDTFEFVTVADNVYETGDVVNIQSSLKHTQALKCGTYYVVQDGQSLTISPTNNKLIGRCIENNYLVQV